MDIVRPSVDIVKPPPVMVHPWEGYDELLGIEGESAVIPYTKLFRESTGLEVSLALAADLPRAKHHVQVVSAGCSFGPEIDTVFGLAQANFPNRYVTVTGVDRNRRALRAAGMAGYSLMTSYAGAVQIYKTLEHDFDHEMARHGIGIKRENATSHHVATLDTGPLRDRYALRFEHADLLLPQPVDGEADLVLGHNIIYHLDFDEADLVLDNLARRVAYHGYLSLGIIGPESHMGLTSLRHVPDKDKPLFGEWYGRAVRDLVQQGVEPVPTEYCHLRLFQRVA